MINMKVFFSIIALITFSGIIIELVYARRTGKNWYNLPDLFANLNISAGHLFWGLIITPIIFTGYHFLYKTFGYKGLESHLPKVIFFVGGYLLTDFIVYWNHRFSHTFNGLIAGHITHHNSKYYNFSTSVRINWVYRGFSWITFAPMALIGFELKYFILFQTIINAYNAICHTRFNINYGPLKYLFVTPEYHRIHHCANHQYYDKNFGGSLIIWDRLFGTFAEVNPDIEYQFGLKTNISSSSPLVINFHYYIEVIRDARRNGLNPILAFFQKPKAHKRYQDEEIKGHNIKARHFMIPMILFISGAFINAQKENLTPIIILTAIVLYLLVSHYISKAIRDQHHNQSKLKDVAIEWASFSIKNKV